MPVDSTSGLDGPELEHSIALFRAMWAAALEVSGATVNANCLATAGAMIAAASSYGFDDVEARADRLAIVFRNGVEEYRRQEAEGLIKPRRFRLRAG